MHDSVIRRLMVAVAVSVPQDDAAYEMLHLDYIDEFMVYYNDKSRELQEMGKPALPVLDEMINFAIQELPIRFADCQSLSDLLSDIKKTEIKRRFVTESIEHMLTSLAKRDKIRDSIRQFLHIKDKRNNHAQIDTTKIAPIVTGFMTMFEESCAASFQFSGTFLEYVMHCFSHFYYPGRKKDIWKILNSVDFAKREAETNISTATMVKSYKTDDLLIHDLLINISKVNELMFEHSGQSENARGVHYDIFYMIMLYKCQQKVKEMNDRLKPYKFQLKFVDERDRKEKRYGIGGNKGIASKISNAKMLIPTLFDMICNGEWNLENITEVRDICFGLGKKDRDGKNCIWKDVKPKAETSRYFDMEDTADNFIAFEQIFKGVLSVHALMTAYEERGLCIVDMYNKCPVLFEDKRLPRSIDRLSALNHIGLILQLMEEGDGAIPNGSQGELLQFEDMVRVYAGSEQNNHANIRTNRAIAHSHGLLDPKARMKQAGDWQTFYKQLQSAAEYMTALPRSYEEYVLTLIEENRLPAHYAPEAILLPTDVVPCAYSALNYNKFMTQNPVIAEYYLYRVATGESTLQSFEWHIANSLFSGVALQQIMQDANGNAFIAEYFCMYSPMVDMFLCVPPDDMDDGTSPLLKARSLDELRGIVNDSYYNGRYTAQIGMVYRALPYNTFNPYIKGKTGVDSDVFYDEALDKSMGFDSFLGFENYGTVDVIKPLKRIAVFPKYRSSVERYSDWMAVLSKVQHSFIDLMQMMLTYGIFISRSSLSTISGKDVAEGKKLVVSLLRADFTESNLNWFFNHLAACDFNPVKINMKWNTVNNSAVEFTDVDLSCLDIIYNRGAGKYKKGSVLYDCYQVLSDYDTVPKRFVQLYNCLNTELSFIRVLRDAYDLVFNIVATELDTLSCELNSRFNIESTLTSGRDNVGSSSLLDFKYALIDTIPVEDIIRYVGIIRQNNWKNFSVLCDDLLTYFKQCRQNISMLVDYDITASSSIQSKFKEWGSAFFAVPTYTHPIVVDSLKDIRARSRVDDSGFIMLHTSYFRGTYGDREFYLHISGRMVEVGPGYIGPAMFDFSKDEDCKRYETIIRNGRGNHAW